ncbi:U3 small nucleolar RNA-associated protein 4 homolog isoform X2 [Phymastichus coffea]|uniref:U3 small nucleolar RNA-associated protein 4 homolog isoform X2 n=1 Tax=Phymastichus coffea TaxID=108790 RepID=UPI00273CBF03|nr:U3 small nucleolar RNA-associated protein 4 homolog isoform X2 [Phymastichus coffea]
MSCKIHNVRFYNLEPKSITCFSYEPRSKKLAVTRNDNSLEIWNIGNAPFIESTITGQSDTSIEAVLWIDSRLFTCGLRGMITEYDLTTLSIKYEVAVTGGAAWCMDIDNNQTHLAVGTEDGYINTFLVTEESLIYEKIFDKQKGRILCLKWDNAGEMIFSGSTDTVRVWNATSGHAIHKMQVARKEVKKETIVWCLAVTMDNMIVSGDSRGVLSIWDSNMGTLIEAHESHAADILSITMSHDKNVIYCAGVDPVIRTFSKVVAKSTGRIQWVRGIERRLHVHDVRALVEAGGKLYSAGVDGYLAQSSYPPRVLVKYPPLLQPPCIYVCSKSRCILLRYHNFLELWRLGDIAKSNTTFERPGHFIIVYSTESHIRVFNFNVIQGHAQLNKQDSDIPLKKKVYKMLFSANSKILATVSNEEGKTVITLYTLNKEHYLSFHGCFTTDKEDIKTVGLLCFSPDNKYLICSDYQSHIIAYNIEGDLSPESLQAWLLPKYTCPPTAMAIQKDTNNLVIVYSDHKIVEYSIPKRKYTEFSNNLQGRLPNQWLARPFPITNIAFDQNNENIIIMHDDTTVFVINKSSDLPCSTTKIAKLENGYCKEESSTSSSTSSQHTIQVVKKYKHLVHLGWMSSSELIAVEVNPTSLCEKLPPTLKQKWFGM